MFAYIKGTLAYSSPVYVVVEAGGIGYQIQISANSLGRLPQLNTMLQLHTSYVVREQSQTLYGFHTAQERDLFELLLGVSGVGPKLALSIIGHLTTQALQQAITQNDIPTLCRVPGIGKKSAERLIIELRDKIPDHLPNLPKDLAISMNDGSTQKIRDAMGALVNLGYHQLAAQKAIKKSLEELPEDSDLATLITNSLQQIKN